MQSIKSAQPQAIAQAQLMFELRSLATHMQAAAKAAVKTDYLADLQKELDNVKSEYLP